MHGGMSPGAPEGGLCTASKSGNGGTHGERNGQYCHGERAKGAIAERQKFSALLKMLRAGLTEHE